MVVLLSNMTIMIASSDIDLINAFNYTVFDYEAKNVQFYSDTIHIEMLSNMPIKLMCLFSSVIMLYAIILLLFAHNK